MTSPSIASRKRRRGPSARTTVSWFRRSVRRAHRIFVSTRTVADELIEFEPSVASRIRHTPGRSRAHFPCARRRRTREPRRWSIEFDGAGVPLRRDSRTAKESRTADPRPREPVPSGSRVPRSPHGWRARLGRSGHPGRSDEPSRSPSVGASRLSGRRGAEGRIRPGDCARVPLALRGLRTSGPGGNDPGMPGAHLPRYRDRRGCGRGLPSWSTRRKSGNRSRNGSTGQGLATSGRTSPSGSRTGRGISLVSLRATHAGRSA